MKTIKKWAWKDSNMKQQKCSQFSGNGKGYKECQNASEIHKVGLDDGFSMDFYRFRYQRDPINFTINF